MTSTFKIQRVCQHCKKEFTARTTVTRYCSQQCNRKALKAKYKSDKVEASHVETVTYKLSTVNQAKAKDFLTPKDVAALLSLSIRTVYKLIESGDIKALRISERVTRIRRQDIDSLFNISKPPQETMNQPQVKSLSDCYHMAEIQQLYNISEKGLYDILKRNIVTKIKKGWYSYVPKTIIHDLLR